MFSKRQPARARASEGPFVSVLDIGTSCIKALVCELRHGKASVVGVAKEGLGERAPFSAAGGFALAPQLLTSLCDLNLRRAEDMTPPFCGHKVVPDQVAIGVGANMLRGFSTTLQVQRVRPAGRVVEEELTTLLQRIQRLAWGQIMESAVPVEPPRASTEGTRPITLPAIRRVRERGSWTLVNSAVAEVQVDGLRVADPLRLQGKTIQATVFNAFIPTWHRDILASLAADLELELTHLIAEPFAVSLAVPAGDAIFLDLGADRTDIALVRNGGVIATASLPQGGRDLSRQIANRLSLTFDKAEESKLQRDQGGFALLAKPLTRAGRRAQSQDPVAEAMGGSLAAWLDGLEQLLIRMAGHEPLPSRIMLCGGGCQSPDVAAALRAPVWIRRLPFVRPPELEQIPPRDVRNLVDRTQHLLSPQDVPVMALAARAAAKGYPETLQDKLLLAVVGA